MKNYCCLYQFMDSAETVGSRLIWYRFLSVKRSLFCEISLLSHLHSGEIPKICEDNVGQNTHPSVKMNSCIILFKKKMQSKFTNFLHSFVKCSLGSLMEYSFCLQFRPQRIVPEQLFCLLVNSTKQTMFINHTDWKHQSWLLLNEALIRFEQLSFCCFLHFV